MEIYDPIHGNIFICPLAKKIIDTEEFQRLRNIKQLGCCYYVFPGASHNRFEHSLGVYHLAKQYIKLLNTDNQFTSVDIKCITVAALIHDLGHGPYSHLFDELVSEEKNHEYRSCELFHRMNTKYSLGFSEEEISFIQKVIFPKNIKEDKKYLYQIVSNVNGVDVDRFDYLMRDIRMIGLNYGIEYKRIMSHSKILNNEIIYSSKVKINIDDFFRTRFIMYKEVYNHHTVRSLEFMVQEFFKQSEKLLGISIIVENDIWDTFIQFTDSIIDLINFLPYVDETLIQLVKRIKRRDIYKLIGEIYSDHKIVKPENGNDFIVDVICVNHKGDEDCKYFHTKNIIDITKEKQTDHCITSVYMKQNDKIEKGIQLFNNIVSMIPEEKKIQVLYHQTLL
jgi:deoxynucleoside triphosphate triphosphohydrolase SAMHD1